MTLTCWFVSRFKEQSRHSVDIEAACRSILDTFVVKHSCVSEGLLLPGVIDFKGIACFCDIQTYSACIVYASTRLIVIEYKENAINFSRSIPSFAANILVKLVNARLMCDSYSM